MAFGVAYYGPTCRVTPCVLLRDGMPTVVCLVLAIVDLRIGQSATGLFVFGSRNRALHYRGMFPSTRTWLYVVVAS